MARKHDWRTEESDLGCADCSPGYDHYPEGGNAWPENLSDVERVTFIPAR